MKIVSPRNTNFSRVTLAISPHSESERSRKSSTCWTKCGTLPREARGGAGRANRIQELFPRLAAFAFPIRDLSRGCRLAEAIPASEMVGSNVERDTRLLL